MKHELVNYFKALSQFETKITILAVKRKCNRSTLTILPSIQFIESNNSDIYSLEVTNIVFYALGFHHLIYFTFKFSEHAIEFTISFPYCVSIVVIIIVYFNSDHYHPEISSSSSMHSFFWDFLLSFFFKILGQRDSLKMFLTGNLLPDNLKRQSAVADLFPSKSESTAIIIHSPRHSAPFPCFPIRVLLCPQRD